MADIYEFNKGNEESNQNQEESCCEMCDLTHEFEEYVVKAVQSGDKDELFGVLRAFANEAGNVALRDYLQNELVSNLQLLDALTNGSCECEDCDGECGCEDED